MSWLIFGLGLVAGGMLGILFMCVLILCSREPGPLNAVLPD